jgi:hypothetical protein
VRGRHHDVDRTVCVVSKAPAVSQGTVTSTGPTSVSAVFARVPLSLP